MQRTLATLSTTAIAALVLSGCGGQDDLESEDSANIGDAETSTEQSADDQDSGEDSAADGDVTFEDQFDLGMGDTGYVSTTIADEAFTVEDVSFVGFWEFLADHDYDPHSSFDPEVVAIVDVTVENIGEEAFDADDSVSNLEFDHREQIEDNLSGRSSFIRSGDPDFDVEGLIDGELSPGDSVSGKLYFPVFNSSYDSWGMTISGGIVACCASNDISWVFDAEHDVDVAADEEQYR